MSGSRQAQAGFTLKKKRNTRKITFTKINDKLRHKRGDPKNKTHNPSKSKHKEESKAQNKKNNWKKTQKIQDGKQQQEKGSFRKH